MLWKKLYISFCLIFSTVCAQEQLTVDLREPTFSEGTLTTEKGGVIQGEDIRIQARCIRYTRKKVEGQPVIKVEAEGDLILELCNRVFIGDRLEYDFQEKTGVVYRGKTAMEPWFFGGETIHLRPDGSYEINNGFVTTSEDECPEWKVTTKSAHLCDNTLLTMHDTQVHVFNLPVFWVHSLKANLNSIFDSPIRYSLRWGGRRGPRLGMVYEAFSWKRWKAFLRLDYRIKRGFGGGVETHYRSYDHKEEFHTINYMARDSSLSTMDPRFRYRLQGVYHNLLLNDKVSLDVTYDKLSDEDMATDYADKGLELETAGQTQFHARRQEDLWIANFLTRVRINGFQTIKQELPTLDWHLRPIALGPTGIVANNRFKISYLDFEYTNRLKDDDDESIHDYNSTRIEFSHQSYRPFTCKEWTFTPQAGIRALYYGNSPNDHARWAVIGEFSGELNTQLHQFYGASKHVIEPYMLYQYNTAPTTSARDHYIFDIEDGVDRLNMLRFGTKHNIYTKSSDGCIRRLLYADLYANAFFNTPTIGQTIPKVYLRLVANSLPSLRHTMATAWDVEHNQCAHFNFRSDWTVSQNAAFAIEYRHRNAFDWRKVDYNNFILDSFVSESKLRRSLLSDKRDTLLMHLYYRFHPSWSVELKSRHGWNRENSKKHCHEKKPSYGEYEVNLKGKLRSAWRVRLSFRRKEEDTRIALFITLGLDRPNPLKTCCPIHHLEY